MFENKEINLNLLKSFAKLGQRRYSKCLFTFFNKFAFVQFEIFGLKNICVKNVGDVFMFENKKINLNPSESFAKLGQKYTQNVF